jgi:PKD repeat protein
MRSVMFAGKWHQTIILCAICALAALVWPAQATSYYIATYGSDSNSGLSTNATQAWATLAHAVSTMSAGDVVYMRGGTYAVSAQISMTKFGSTGSRYTITNYPGEIPTLNCSGQSGSSEGIRITGSYWQLYGLVITNAAHNGINIRGGTTALMGSFNRIERCVVVGCRNSGLLIGSNSGTFTASPGTNLVVNCDAIRNFDSPDGQDADGFSAKWVVGTGNEFHGCRAWENSDDGWDLWMAPSPIIISNCWAFRNGSNVWGSIGFTGNGNGFKLGGNYVPANHRLVQGLAYQNVGNGGNGVDQNNNTGSLTVDHITSWANRNSNYNLNHDLTYNSNEYHVVRNCISMAPGTDNDAFTSHTTQLSNSWQVITSPSVNANDFVSMDTSQLIAPRQADGSLPVITLVHPVSCGRLVDKGYLIPGYPYNGCAPDLGAYETTDACPPVAVFTGTPTNGPAPLAVTFTDTSTGCITNRYWDFGDGATSNTAAATMNHTYNNAINANVTLIVSDSVGSSTTNTKTSYIVVTGGETPPVDPYASWASNYFGCVSCEDALPDADPLGKGFSNTNQFLLGLNPTNPASVFRITSVATDSSSNVVITWSTAGVRTNAVQVTAGDGSGGYSTNDFLDLSGATFIINVSSDTTTNCVDVGGATNVPARYYRIRLVP